MLQKFVSLLLILTYFLLPVMCYADPCETHTNSPAEITGTSTGHQAAVDRSEAAGTDGCEITCCCAGHIPLSSFTAIPHVLLMSRLLPFEPQLALPRLLDRIFVPPQNHS